MPNAHYDRGRGAEYRAKKRLEADGWTVFRTAGSKSPCDLVAFKPIEVVGEGRGRWRIRTTPVFCQVKNGVRPMPRREREAFASFARAHGARPLLIERGNVWTWIDHEEAA